MSRSHHDNVPRVNPLRLAPHNFHIAPVHHRQPLNLSKEFDGHRSLPTNTSPTVTKSPLPAIPVSNARRASLLALFAGKLLLFCLLLPTALLAAGQDLPLKEATDPHAWRCDTGVKVHGPVFISGDDLSTTCLRIELPLTAEGAHWATLPLAKANWSRFKFLQVRAFSDTAFETPLDCALEDEAGHRVVSQTPLAFGAPGWNECTIPLATIAPVDPSQLKSLSLGLSQPRSIRVGDPQHGRFYLAEIRLLTEQPASAPTVASDLVPLKKQPTATLRVSLDRIFPQHLPVSKFHVAVGTNLITRLDLTLTDEILFDTVARSNFTLNIEHQAAAIAQQTNQLGISFSIVVPPITTASPLKQAAFQNWLGTTYRTIGDLNGRWNSSHQQFTEITWPQADQAAPWRDAVSFWQQRVSATMRDCTQAARRGAPRAYLFSHFERLRGDDWRQRPLDYYTIQRTVGWSHYSLADGGGDSREFISGGETRALVSALGTQINRRLWADSFDWKAPEGGWLTGRSERWLTAVASRNLWLQLAAGKDGVTVPTAVPQFDQTLVQTSALWPVFAATRRASPKLAVLCSSGSRLMNRSAEAEERWFYESFWGAGFDPAVIFEETFHDYPKALTDYNVLALGAATHLPNWLQDALIDWTNNGGVLLCSGLPGLQDPWGRRLARLLWEVFGIDDAKPVTTGTDWRWQIDPAKLKAGTELLATDEAGQPLAIRAKYGRGEVVVSLVPFRTIKPLRDFWRWKLGERVKRDIESLDPNLYIDWRTTENPKTCFAIAINLSPYMPLKSQVAAYGQFSRVLNLCDRGGANPLPLMQTEVATTFPIELPPGGGAVLMLEKSAVRK